MKRIKTTKMGTDYCPNCGKLCDRASAAYGNSIPDPGDITVCFYCGSVNKFGKYMELEKVSEEELDSFEPTFQAKIALVQLEIMNRIKENA